ncbi:MAG: NfeD family protein [Candidatus Melainabacteria bacterium]|jgi:membrane protein implicated in regulation of membrane protease activity
MIISSPYFWFSLTLICLVIEIVTPGFVWAAFAVGASVAAVCSVFIHDLYVLCLIFSIASIITFFLCRPWYLKFIAQKSTTNKFGFQSLIGKSGIITKQVNSQSPGYIRVDGDEWKAETKDGEFEIGTKAKISRVEGNSVWIESLTE